MQVSESVMATPYYVLMDQNTPFSVRVADSSLDIEYTAILGFSDKSSYDNFCGECSTLLMPYPLVKGYLRRELGTPNTDDTGKQSIKLVVLDSPGPHEPTVHAATMQAVLEAQEKDATHLAPTHHLAFQPETSVYRLEKPHG